MFNEGDRVRYTAARWKAEAKAAMYHPENIGWLGTVRSGNTDGLGSVIVDWDNKHAWPTSAPSDSVYAGNVDLVEPADSKTEDPRTPETVYADSVDELFRRYAKRLDKGIHQKTLVYPYSHIGILAEFLMEYNRLEKP
jgi:hypothetical protein